MNVPDSRAPLRQHQHEGLRRLLETILPDNAFYRGKFATLATDRIDSPAFLQNLPFTSKSELIEDQRRHPPFGSDLTFAQQDYIRIHQTSGTTGKPLYWLDTEESWDWWAECWKTIFAAAGVGADDRIYFAFSFGPFIGFWAGWEGARKIGALAISGGAQSTAQRLKSMVDHGATVLVCTPTYALHLAAEAKKAGMDLAKNSAVRIAIHAGEPGASIPSTRKIIEESWGATLLRPRGRHRGRRLRISVRVLKPAASTSTRMNSSPKLSIPSAAPRWMKMTRASSCSPTWAESAAR